VLVRCLASVSRGSCAHPMGKRDCAWCCTGRKEPSGWVVAGGRTARGGGGHRPPNSHVLLLEVLPVWSAVSQLGRLRHPGFSCWPYLSAAAGSGRNLIDSTKGHGVALEVGLQKKCRRRRELLKSRRGQLTEVDQPTNDTAPGTGRVLTTRGGPSLVSAQAVRPRPINQRVIVSVSCTSAAASWAKWIILHDTSAWP
jgi:hypothetical protein